MDTISYKEIRNKQFNKFIENAAKYPRTSYKEYWTLNWLKVIRPELYKNIMGER